MSWDSRRVERWYFGGVASAGGVMITHPLDLMKVLIQTQKEKLSIPKMTIKILREKGPLGLYSGISASMMRQFTYSFTRFGLYSAGSKIINTDSMSTKIALASAAGGVGGFVGTPADLLNVRMQNDVKLAPEQRRNYKNAIDGFVRVYKEEGFRTLFNGATMCSMRGVLMTVGQIAFYEQVKQILLSFEMFEPNMKTWIIASIAAGVVANTICQPLDVIKTRSMNAKPGEYSSLGDVFIKTAHEGPLAFFKGYVPAFLRLAPTTIILFLLLEQLRYRFGYIPEPKSKPTVHEK